MDESKEAEARHSEITEQVSSKAVQCFEKHREWIFDNVFGFQKMPELVERINLGLESLKKLLPGEKQEEMEELTKDWSEASYAGVFVGFWAGYVLANKELGIIGGDSKDYERGH